jgi:hypothetical protein
VIRLDQVGFTSGVFPLRSGQVKGRPPNVSLVPRNRPVRVTMDSWVLICESRSKDLLTPYPNPYLRESLVAGTPLGATLGAKNGYSGFPPHPGEKNSFPAPHPDPKKRNRGGVEAPLWEVHVYYTIWGKGGFRGGRRLSIFSICLYKIDVACDWRERIK